MLFAHEYDELRHIVTDHIGSFRHSDGFANDGGGGDQVVVKVGRNDALVTPDTDDESRLVNIPHIAVLLISFNFKNVSVRMGLIFTHLDEILFASSAQVHEVGFDRLGVCSEYTGHLHTLLSDCE